MTRKKSEVDEVNADVAASLDFEDPEQIQILDDDGLSGDLTDSVSGEIDKQQLTVVPSMESISWTPWVMSQFEPSELDQGLPKVDGLRRLTRKLIGPILKGSATIKQWPTIENEHRATVEYTVIVLNKYNLEVNEEPYEVEFTDVADAYLGNIRGIAYAIYPSAMASTRAQVRALRMALNLAVVGVDEVSDQPLEESGLSGKITESQITKIDIKCQQLDIDVLKFINMGKQKYKDITSVTSNTAIKMFGLINKYQQYDEAKSGMGEPIPDTIRGYNSKWRGDF